MEKLPLRLTTRLIRALRRQSFRGVPGETTLDGYTVRVQGIDIFTGSPTAGSSPRIEVWHGAFSHSAPFEVHDSRWPKSQWNMLQAALSQCLDVKPRTHES